MKKIVIVEDKPWATGDAVRRLKKGNVDVLRIVYYPNPYGDADEKRKLIRELEEKTSVQIDTVNNQEEFVEKMEELYAEPDVVFFMDYDLKGDRTVNPEDRINFRYTKLKEYRENQDANLRKIWFYTISCVTNLEIITHNFPENVLHVDNYTDGQLTWDAREIDQILG